MSYCGSKPGMCGKSPDCADHYCPGRTMADEVAVPLPLFVRWSIGVCFAICALVMSGAADPLLRRLG